ncbi:MAG: DUF2239 family protein [Sphingobium sp.]
MTTLLTAFLGEKRIASGDEAALRTTLRSLTQDAQSVLLFDDATGRQVDIDLRDPAASGAPPSRGRGRPSLGVKAREVTLMPRHWDWLARQRGGASAALRRLIDQASRDEGGDAQALARRAMDAAYAFSTAMAGNRPGYEAAIRALYAGDEAGFTTATEAWPADIAEHARRLAVPAFAAP